MSEDHRRRPRPLAAHDVEVGAADPDRRHPYENVVRAGPVELDLGDLEPPPGRPEERRARSHFFAAALLGLAARFFAGVRFAAGFDAVFRLSAATTSLVGTRSAMFVSA